MENEGEIGYSGAWTGLFELIARPTASSQGINVFNTYNPKDHILRIDRPFNERWTSLISPAVSGIQFARASHYHAWMTAQLLLKPYEIFRQ